MQNAGYTKRYSLPEYYDVTDRFIAYTKGNGVEPATLAVAWVVSNQTSPHRLLAHAIWNSCRTQWPRWMFRDAGVA